MGADLIAEISPGIREAIDGGPDWCATFTVSGNPDKWVQFTGGTVNAAYPYESAPDQLLTELGSFELTDWEQSKFLTGVLDLQDSYAISRWLNKYFDVILGCDEDSSVDVELEQL